MIFMVFRQLRYQPWVIESQKSPHKETKPWVILTIGPLYILARTKVGDFLDRFVGIQDVVKTNRSGSSRKLHLG